ncbi:MAG: UDP-N-acetylmuramoyl-L-alanyl-D-glutamate--2,6-diaminopimelate ligase, partial [Caldimicrobium sp.]
QLVITGITDDSRKVEGGNLFIARKGKTYSGEVFIKEAIQKGASVILRESPIDIHLTVPQIRVRNLKEIIGEIVLNFYDHPERLFTFLGITGTNGKSSTSYLLASLLQNLGYKVGYIGTLYYDIGEVLSPRETTPSIIDLAPLLKRGVEKGLEYIVMEVSSHALDQDRIFPLKFKVAGFTNLSRDHLDYHKDMMEYFEAKKKLFTKYLEKEGKAVISLESNFGKILAEALIAEEVLREDQIIKVNNGDIKVRILERYPGLVLFLETREGTYKVETRLLGDYQAKNVGTMCGCVEALGIRLKEILPLFKKLTNPPGRLELCGKKGTASIFVDYAHTPEALEFAIKSLLPLKKGKFITLFGCGGNRDPGKRPLMGKLASEYSDVVILTSDNPRFEDPIKIIEEIKMGIKENKSYYCISDRREAIEFAIKNLQDGDILLIAGKGHEDYQEIAGKRYPFSDREVVKEILRGLGENAY